MGGTDPHNVGELVIDSINQKCYADINFKIILGPNQISNFKSGKIKQLRTNLTVKGPQPSLSDLMSKSDLMIGGGGTTNWERMCLGLPAMVIGVASNQFAINKALSDEGFINYLGQHDEVTELLLQITLTRLLNSPELLLTQSKMMSNLIDGLGLERVGQHILKNYF